MRSHGCFTRGKEENQIRNCGRKKTAIFFLCLLLFFSCAIYVFQTNSIATMGFEIRKVEDQVALMREENRQLTIQATQAKSVLNLEIDRMNNEEECFLTKMKKPEKVGFLEIEVEKDFAMK